MNLRTIIDIVDMHRGYLGGHIGPVHAAIGIRILMNERNISKEEVDKIIKIYDEINNSTSGWTGAVGSSHEIYDRLNGKQNFEF